jgi:hypothetical protein
MDQVYVFTPELPVQLPLRPHPAGVPAAARQPGLRPRLAGLLPEPHQPGRPQASTIPRTAVGSLTTISQWEGDGDGTTASLTHSFVGNFTWLRGNHNLRFGPEYRVYRENRNRFPASVAPDLSFGQRLGTRAAGQLPRAAGRLRNGRPAAGDPGRQHDGRGQLRGAGPVPGLLRSGRLESDPQAHREPGTPGRARDAHHGALQPLSDTLLRRPVQPHRGGRSGQLRQEPDSGSSVEPVPRTRRPGIRRRGRQPSRLLERRVPHLDAARRASPTS